MGLVISWADDRSQQFEDALIGICEKYGCNHLAAEFNKI